MNKQEIIKHIERNVSWGRFIFNMSGGVVPQYNGWYLSADGPSEEECYLTNYDLYDDGSGDIISIKDTKFRSAGWYHVVVYNPNPAKNEVKSFTEFVYYDGEEWDMEHLERFTIGEVIGVDSCN